MVAEEMEPTEAEVTVTAEDVAGRAAERAVPELRPRWQRLQSIALPAEDTYVALERHIFLDVAIFEKTLVRSSSVHT